MWEAVQKAFRDLTVPLEADIPHMYRDVLGYVTWGIGLKDDPGPTSKTLKWKWMKGNGYVATDAEVRAEWARIKAGPVFASNAAKIATMYLPEIQRDLAFDEEAVKYDGILRTQYAWWGSAPADGQLALMSMAWNFGPYLRTAWPTFSAKLDAGDWAYAAQNCEPAAGPNDRSHQNKILFFQAARAQLWGDRPAALYGPEVTLSIGKLAAAMKSPSSRSATAWWVQAALQDGGWYTLTLDGEFGPRSQAAWSSFASARKLPAAYTRANLAELAKLTLVGATVTD